MANGAQLPLAEAQSFKNGDPNLYIDDNFHKK